MVVVSQVHLIKKRKFKEKLWEFFSIAFEKNFDNFFLNIALLNLTHFFSSKSVHPLKRKFDFHILSL